jgi:hypothetical protein
MSQRSPAIVRYKGRIGIFSVTVDGRLKYSMSNPWTCQDVDKCPEPAFTYHLVSGLGAVDAVDAAAINVNGSWVVIAVAIRPDGTMFETSLRDTGSQVVFGTLVPIPASSAAGEPSLAASRDGRQVVLAYRGADGVLRYRKRLSAGWGVEEQVKVGGFPLTMPRISSPGIAFTRLPTGIATQESLVGAFSTGDGYMKLYTLGGIPNVGWVRLPIQHGIFPLSVGRPALAWTDADAPDDPRTGATQKSVSVGRFYLAFSPAEAGAVDARGPLSWAMSHVNETGKLEIGLYSFYDNVWAFAFGIDFLQPNEVGLRAATTYAIPNAFNQVGFRPHADGIADLPYRNYNDWPVLAWASCQVLAQSQPLNMKSLCPPKPL